MCRTFFRVSRIRLPLRKSTHSREESSKYKFGPWSGFPDLGRRYMLAAYLGHSWLHVFIFWRCAAQSSCEDCATQVAAHTARCFFFPLAAGCGASVGLSAELLVAPYVQLRTQAGAPKLATRAEVADSRRWVVWNLLLCVKISNRPENAKWPEKKKNRGTLVLLERFMSMLRESSRRFVEKG